jgi:hypothetical protein
VTRWEWCSSTTRMLCLPSSALIQQHGDQLATLLGPSRIGVDGSSADQSYGQPGEVDPLGSLRLVGPRRPVAGELPGFGDTSSAKQTGRYGLLLLPTVTRRLYVSLARGNPFAEKQGQPRSSLNVS